MARVEVTRYDLYSLLYCTASWGLTVSTSTRRMGESFNREAAAKYAEVLIRRYTQYLTDEQRCKLAERILDFVYGSPWGIAPKQWERLAKWLLEQNQAETVNR